MFLWYLTLFPSPGEKHGESRSPIINDKQHCFQNLSLFMYRVFFLFESTKVYLGEWLDTQGFTAQLERGETHHYCYADFLWFKVHMKAGFENFIFLCLHVKSRATVQTSVQTGLVEITLIYLKVYWLIILLNGGQLNNSSNSAQKSFQCYQNAPL